MIPDLGSRMIQTPEIPVTIKQQSRVLLEAVLAAGNHDADVTLQHRVFCYIAGLVPPI